MIQRLNKIVVPRLVAVIWIVVCIAVFVGFSGQLSWVAIFLLGLFAYSSIMLWKTVFSWRIAPLELTFWLFHTNFLLLPALSQSSHRTFYWSSYNLYSQESLLYACSIIAIGLFAFRFGARLGQIRMKEIGGDVRTENFLNSPLGLSWKTRLFLVTILIGLALLVMNLGTSFFMSSRMSNLSRVESMAELGLFLALPRAIGYGILLFSVALLVQRWRQGRGISLTVTTIFIVAVGLNVIINFPLSVARSWIFGFLISLLWIIAPLRYVMFRGMFVIGMTILQFTILPWYSQITRGKGQVEFDIESLRQYMYHGDFDVFQSLVNITLYIQESGFELGRNLISVILFFVPRSIWNKAEPLGTAAADFAGYEYTNLSAPIYGEFYADFGLLSLIFGMGIIGFWMRLLDKNFHRMVSAKRFGIGILLTSVLSGYLVIILRGSLLGVMPIIASLFAVLVIASWLSRRKMPRARSINFHFSQKPKMHQ